MIRRYLIALVGALVGGGFALAVGLLIGRILVWLVVACALGAAGFLMAKGESFGLIPPSDEIGKPTSIFNDKGNRS
ncbi:MAG: hypothetical protein M3444_12360 [Acidobacteriota bacterium]|nr:hypothetical protein [Acidobacteriota bacterium]MDQ5837832.1 hypothetical protein [Acidobacteriota bacterium]